VIDLPILDSHMHLDPRGASRTTVESFMKEGGTHLFVIHKPYHNIRIEGEEDYGRAYEQTLELAERARSFGVSAHVFLGPYPGDMVQLSRRYGVERAKEIQLEAVDIALQLVEEGLCLGIGEIGRIHFPVEEKLQFACDEVMSAVFRGCRKAGCPVQLHTESIEDNPDLMVHIAGILDREGLDRAKAIKHYCGASLVQPDINLGMTPSVQASRSNLKEALPLGQDLFLETDYIDDPNRPGVVMPLDTVAKKVKWAYRTGLMDADMHHRLMVELPGRICGIDMEKAAGSDR